MRFKVICVSSTCMQVLLATSIHGVYKEDSNTATKQTDKDNVMQHIFKEDVFREHNPLFTNTYKKANLSYASTLGLSNKQTLMFNGLTTRYMHPFIWKKLQIETFANIAMGNTLLTMQNTQNDAFFFGINTGANVSTPLPMQDIIAHVVSGIDIGFGTSAEQTSNMLLHGYVGIDFFYERYVFRPFFSLSLITPFSNVYDVSVAGLADIGLKTFYRGDYILSFINIAISNLFSKNNAGVFTLLPQSTPLLLSKNALRFDVHTNIDYFVTQYLSFNAATLITYTSSYYALSMGGQVGVCYRF